MTYGVSLAQRLDVHEGQGLVALEELEGGNFTWKRVRGVLVFRYTQYLGTCHQGPLQRSSTQSLDETLKIGAGECKTYP